MKSVLISIQPKWVEKIANGEKTIEVRKSAPKCGVPFKGYIYATKKARLQTIFKKGEWIFSDDHSFGKFDENIFVKDSLCAWQGKVVGECIIDKIDEIVPDYNPVTAKFYYGYVADTAATCLSEEELQKYGKNKSLYFWHISDLKIYDKPKELSEFYYCCKEMKANEPRAGKYVSLSCYACRHNALKRTEDYSEYNNMLGYICKRNITRPPQSWCYVEGI